MRPQSLFAVLLLAAALNGCGTAPPAPEPTMAMTAVSSAQPELRGSRLGPSFSNTDRPALPSTDGSHPGATATGLTRGRVALLQSDGRQQKVVVYEAATRTPVEAGPMPPWYGPSAPRVSTDGRFVVYLTQEGANPRLVLWDLTARAEIRVPDAGNIRDPDLDGTGSRLIYLRGSVLDTRLCVYDRTSGTEHTLPLRSDQMVSARTPTLSGDGRTAAYVAASSRGDTNLFLLDLTTNRPISPPTLNSIDQDRDPALSADGSVVLFSSDRAGTFDLYAYDLKTSRFYDMAPYNSLADDSQPRFVGPADAGLCYVSDREGAATAYLSRLTAWR